MSYPVEATNLPKTENAESGESTSAVLSLSLGSMLFNIYMAYDLRRMLKRSPVSAAISSKIPCSALSKALTSPP